MPDKITTRAMPPVTTKEFTILMASLMSIVAISIDAMLPALGIIGADLHAAHENQPQYIIGFIFIGMAIGQLIAGPLSDAIGRKPVLYIGLGLYLCGSVIGYFAQTLDMVLIGRLIQGLGVAGPYVSAMSIVRDKYSGRDMAQIMSLIMMIFILVPAIAPSLGQAILWIATWRDIFLLYIGYSVAIGLWLFLRLDETLKAENRIPFRVKNIVHGFKEIVTNRTTAGYTLCMGICFGSFIGYLNSSQQIFQNQFHTGDAFTLYFGGLALVLGAASLFNSKFVQKLGMRYICLRSIICIIAASAVFLAVNYMTDIALWMFVVYAAILFFAFGLMFGNLNALAMEPMGHIAGIASAVIGAVSSVISLTLGTMIGQLYDGTLIPLTAGFLGLGIISFAVMAYTARAKFATAS